MVIPCYKEDETIVCNIYNELTMRGAEVIIVDDGGTMDLDYEYNVVRHVPNMGYGYALKRGIERASNQTVLTIDGDGQHTVSDAVKLYKAFNLLEDCKMVVGSRWNLKENNIRWIARKGLNFLATIIGNHYMVDLNSGMRVFDKKIATNYFPILCDTFSFTTSLTMSVVTDGHKIAYFPINVQPRVVGNSRVKLFQDGLVTLYYIVWVGLALRTRKLRAWIRRILNIRLT